MTEISASLLSADQGNLRGEVERIKDVVDSLHFDIMDGHFVPEIGLGMGVVEALREQFPFPFYVHLMVEEPEKYIDRFSSADVIYIHWEASPHIARALDKIKEKGLRAGVALNPATPVSLLEEVWDMLDVLLIMTVNPGYAGQHILPFTLSKVRKARDIISAKGLPTKIAVDGGIDNKTVREVWEAGASIMVVGSYIFQSNDPLKAVQSLREKLRGG